MIGEDQLMEAVERYGQLANGTYAPDPSPEGIEAIMVALAVEPVDFRALFGVFADFREPHVADSKRAAYLGGALDGFCLGLIAGRFEHE